MLMRRMALRRNWRERALFYWGDKIRPSLGLRPTTGGRNLVPIALQIHGPGEVQIIVVDPYGAFNFELQVVI